MLRSRIPAPLSFLRLCLGMMSLSTLALASTAPSPEAIFTDHLKPFVSDYCYDCHSDDIRKGDLALDRFSTGESVRSHRDVWERVLDQASHHLMPPADEPQPSEDARTAFVDWLDRTLHPIDPDHPDPGRVVLRRLNREEYKNTVQDIFGITFNPAENFPEDDSGYGFDNIGDVLTLSPLLFERYLDAARQISEAVIVEPKPAPRHLAPSAEEWRGAGTVKATVRELATNGRMSWNVKVPATGRYRLTLKVFEDHAGNEPARFAVRTGTHLENELSADGSRKAPRSRSLDLRLNYGANTLSLDFLNDFYRPAKDGKPAVDRNFYLASADLEGPFEPQPLPPSEIQQRLFGKPHFMERKDAWLKRTLTPFASNAFRRPAAPAEIARLVGLVNSSVKAGESPESGLRLALQAMMVSPSFLFRGEPPEHNEKSSEVYALSDYALATRLSYFLWTSLPDERLRTEAANGSLHKSLHTEVERMLVDPKSMRFVANFAGQWLQLRNLPLHDPDPKLFPDWNPKLANAMEEETFRFFKDFLSNERPLHEMLTADWTYVDAPLARHYGLTIADAPEWQKVKLPEGRRAGLLTQASILTVTSYPNRTSPVLRGKFILEKILGTPPPPPPPNVPSLDESNDAHAPVTLRARLELHRKNPSCATCHALIDPIGFALEHYDALGVKRDSDHGQPIDSAGQLVTGEHVNSPEELAIILAGAKRAEFYRNFASTLLTYALGRGLDYYDRPTVDKIVADAAKNGSTLPAFIHAVVDSIAFRLRRGELQAGNHPVVANVASK